LERTFVIYAIQNKINGKRYIGSTVNLYNRKHKHLGELRKNIHHSSILQRAYNKYGESAFGFIVLDTLKATDEEEIHKREQEYFDLLNPAYNISRIARQFTRLGLKNSPEHCTRMSKALKGRKSPMEGKKFSKEHRKKISEANKGNCHKGWHHSEEAKRKISLNHNKKSNLPKSETTKKKISKKVKEWHDSLTEEQKKEWKQKILNAKRRKK